MRAALFALVVALVAFALPAPARADTCSGEAASTEDCNALVEKKGAMSFSFGWGSEDFDPNGHMFDVKQAGYTNQIGHFEGNSLAPMHGNGFFIDVRLHATPHFYAGVDLGAAWAGAPDARFVAEGEMLTWDSAVLLTMAGVVGARIPLGRFSVRGELVAGIHGAQLVAMASSPQPLEADTVAALVEPRVAVDVWLHKWWVVEAFAGVNALDRSEHVFGIGLGFHSQAFDGRY